MRRTALILSLVAGLVLAGAAGAIVQGKIFTVKTGDYARLGSTSILCQAVAATNFSYFDCSRWSASIRVARSYSASIGEGGVSVYRWDVSGKSAKLVKTYR
jgi:Trk-type K+ transport system membrane component